MTKKEDNMSERDPRKMALQIAGLRASETCLPEGERVFHDPYAEYFLTDEMREGLRDLDQVRAAIAQYEQMMPGVNGAIVARIRFIDECLLECVADGFKQLVIIGAGYDTRAYRIEGVKENIKVFEVDHPATQLVKVEKIKEIFKKLPDHVEYVPVVFGSDRLDQKLFENDYNSRLKTLFVVEGLLMYIPPQAVDGLLSLVVNASGPGSTFVADYFNASVIDGTSPLKEAQVLRQFVEGEGAPLLFGIEEGKTEEFFEERGFSTVAGMTAAACKESYFKNASRDRTVSPMFNFVRATVATGV
jgi:methyltransferase (TIGR00027 family)